MLISSNIIDRIIEHKGFKTDVELSEYWGVTATSVTNWRKRNSIPFKKIITFCEDEGISLNYMFSGTGDKYLKTGEGKGSKKQTIIEIEHIDIVKDFKDKPLAKDANEDLRDIEKIHAVGFREVCAYIKGVANGLRMNSGKTAMGETSPRRGDLAGKKKSTG